MGVVHKTINT